LPASADGITTEQFRVDFRNRGGLFGAGIYFAEKSTKSDEYARETVKDGPHKGCRVLLLCRVTLGNVGVAKRSGSATRHGENHSTLGLAAYREFVVSSPDQVFPNYILYYERS